MLRGIRLVAQQRHRRVEPERLGQRVAREVQQLSLIHIFELRATVTPFFVKFIGPGTRMRRVRVNGGPGAYLSGAPHDVLFQASGTVQTDRVRIAGNVLIWQQGPLTLRIEGARTLVAALALARSLR